MTPSDADGFFTSRGAYDPEAVIELDYRFVCVGDPRIAAAHLCSEQSTAQWSRVGVCEKISARVLLPRSWI